MCCNEFPDGFVRFSTFHPDVDMIEVLLDFYSYFINSAANTVLWNIQISIKNTFSCIFGKYFSKMLGFCDFVHVLHLKTNPPKNAYCTIRVEIADH